jgi:cyclophilin family peptidyl-prolyl cis-trans isomerase
VKRFFLLTLAASALGAGQSSGQEKNPVVQIDTSLGTIKVELFEDKAPITVKNFLSYVDDKFFDGTIFHRVIPDFMIQGGGFESGMSQKRTKAPIRNEAANGVSNERGTLAMARTNDPNSATAQFYINLKDNNFLDQKNDPRGVGYCVFGKVISGMDVVDKIAKVQTGNKSGHQNVPAEDVVIKSIRRVDKK